VPASRQLGPPQRPAARPAHATVWTRPLPEPRKSTDARQRAAQGGYRARVIDGFATEHEIYPKRGYGVRAMSELNRRKRFQIQLRHEEIKAVDD